MSIFQTAWKFSLSGSERESGNEDDTRNLKAGTRYEQTKNEPPIKSGVSAKSKRTSGRRGKAIESDNSDVEDNEEMSKGRKLQAVANRHTKVLFENENSNTFSRYRCASHRNFWRFLIKTCLAGLRLLLVSVYMRLKMLMFSLWSVLPALRSSIFSCNGCPPKGTLQSPRYSTDELSKCVNQSPFLATAAK